MQTNTHIHFKHVHIKMNWNKNEEYMERHGWNKGKGEMMWLNYVLKNIKVRRTNK